VACALRHDGRVVARRDVITRFLVALVVPAFFSLHLLACASEDGSDEPQHDVVQNELVQEGGECAKDSDCASDLCEFTQATAAIGIRGKPAPCEDCSDNGQPTPAPTGQPEPDPTPAPAPAPKGKPEPTPAPAPAPTPAKGVCVTR
jgi:hypothetical protein